MSKTDRGSSTEMSNLFRDINTTPTETDLLKNESKAYESINNSDQATTSRTNNNNRPSSPAIIATSNEYNQANVSADIDVKIVDPKDKKRNKPKSTATAVTGSSANAVVSGSAPGSNSNPTSDGGGGGDANVLDDEEQVEEEVVLKYGATHVIKLFIPVTTCLVFVIISLSFITSYRDSGGAHLIYTPFNEDSQKSGGTKLWMSVANAFIFIGVVIIMTIVLILLYKFNCYKIIHGWLAFSSFMLLFFFTYMFISELFKQFNLVTDMFTIAIILWNFGILGMFCIHWKGPLILQQVFLIFSCIQMALVFIKYLPEWTTWVLLALISIWDLVAVLCPFGPLRILVETARDRNDNLFPAMVYSSTLIYTLMTKLTDDDDGDDNARAKKTDDSSRNENSNNQARTSSRPTSNSNSKGNKQVQAKSGLRNNAQTNDEENEADGDSDNDNEDGGFREPSENYVPAKNKQPKSNNSNRQNEHNNNIRQRHNGSNDSTRNDHRARIEQLEHQQQEEQENGVKLGLGDFIFYSILVGKASILGDWNTVIACFVAILIGLCLTLVLLAVFHKPLPALPISLFFGLIFYFLTNLVVRPFYDELTYRQVFI